MVDARVLQRAILLLTIIGLGASFYAVGEFYDPALDNACSLSGIISCRCVALSGDTGFPPPHGIIPDFVVGVAGFLLLTVAAVQLFRTSKERWLQATLLLSGTGAAIAVALGYVEVAIIGCLCPVCLTCYLADAGVLILAILLWRLRRLPLDENAEPQVT